LAQTAELAAREVGGEPPYQMLVFGRCHKPHLWIEWQQVPFGGLGILKSFKNEGGLGGRLLPTMRFEAAQRRVSEGIGSKCLFLAYVERAVLL
jgi:hypothetical protein